MPAQQMLFARRLLRWLRVAVPALVIALPPLPWVLDATRRASLAPLGARPGIFQYVAWALIHGEVDYRDVRDVNGPHARTSCMRSSSRSVARTSTGFTCSIWWSRARRSRSSAGACPDCARGARPVGSSALRGPSRGGWSSAGSTSSSTSGRWPRGRASSDWFMLPAVGVQLLAQAPWRSHAGAAGQGRQRRLLALAGALSVIPWFGKPTYALLPRSRRSGVSLLVDDGLRAPFSTRRRALGAFVVGGAIAAALMTALVLAFGDLGAFVRIQLVDVPAMYRFIWPRSAADIFSDPWRATQAAFALCGAVVLLALVAVGEMPRRVLAVALVPPCALLGIVAQGKGFPYHFHPVTAGAHLQWLTVAAWLAERTRVARRRWAIARAVPVAVGVAIAFRVATAMQDSPHVRALWLLWGARTPAERETAEYFDHFRRPDFFPFEMRQAAAYLRRHTAPDDRVQSYGMDAYVLFLAERASATPYIYAYDLNVDAALEERYGRRPRRRSVRSNPRHPRRSRSRHARAPHGTSARGVRVHGWRPVDVAEQRMG